MSVQRSMTTVHVCILFPFTSFLCTCILFPFYVFSLYMYIYCFLFTSFLCTCMCVVSFYVFSMYMYVCCFLLRLFSVHVCVLFPFTSLLCTCMYVVSFYVFSGTTLKITIKINNTKTEKEGCGVGWEGVIALNGSTCTTRDTRDLNRLR